MIGHDLHVFRVTEGGPAGGAHLRQGAVTEDNCHSTDIVRQANDQRLLRPDHLHLRM